MAFSTAAEYQNFILAELQETAGSALGLQIVGIWNIYDSIGDLYIQYLYARAHAIQFLMTMYYKYTTLTVGKQTIDLSKWIDNLERLYKLTMDLIDRSKAGDYDFQIGMIEQTAPIMPPTYESISDYLAKPMDANDTRYRGDPYKPIGGNYTGWGSGG